MNLLIAAGGTWRSGAAERGLFDAYCARLPWKAELHEIDIKAKGDTEKDRAREGEKMLELAERFHPHHRIALDERGKNLTSRDFAGLLARWNDEGENKLMFFIGGHYGLDAEVRRRADLVLSFGQMTWPHLLTRLLLAEQLYRAQTIISGHPYHRD